MTMSGQQSTTTDNKTTSSDMAEYQPNEHLNEEDPSLPKFGHHTQRRRSSIGGAAPDPDGLYVRSNFTATLTKRRRSSIGVGMYATLEEQAVANSTVADPLALARQRLNQQRCGDLFETESATSDAAGGGEEDGLPMWKKKLLEKKRMKEQEESAADATVPTWKKALLEKKRKEIFQDRQSAFTIKEQPSPNSVSLSPNRRNNSGAFSVYNGTSPISGRLTPGLGSARSSGGIVSNHEGGACGSSSRVITQSSSYARLLSSNSEKANHSMSDSFSKLNGSSSSLGQHHAPTYKQDYGSPSSAGKYIDEQGVEQVSVKIGAGKVVAGVDVAADRPGSISPFGKRGYISCASSDDTVSSHLTDASFLTEKITSASNGENDLNRLASVLKIGDGDSTKQSLPEGKKSGSRKELKPVAKPEKNDKDEDLGDPTNPQTQDSECSRNRSEPEGYTLPRASSRRGDLGRQPSVDSVNQASQHSRASTAQAGDLANKPSCKKQRKRPSQKDQNSSSKKETQSSLPLDLSPRSNRSSKISGDSAASSELEKSTHSAPPGVGGELAKINKPKVKRSSTSPPNISEHSKASQPGKGGPPRHRKVTQTKGGDGNLRHHSHATHDKGTIGNQPGSPPTPKASGKKLGNLTPSPQQVPPSTPKSGNKKSVGPNASKSPPLLGKESLSSHASGISTPKASRLKVGAAADLPRSPSLQTKGNVGSQHSGFSTPKSLKKKSLGGSTSSSQIAKGSLIGQGISASTQKSSGPKVSVADLPPSPSLQARGGAVTPRRATRRHSLTGAVPTASSMQVNGRVSMASTTLRGKGGNDDIGIGGASGNRTVMPVRKVLKTPQGKAATSTAVSTNLAVRSKPIASKGSQTGTKAQVASSKASKAALNGKHIVSEGAPSETKGQVVVSKTSASGISHPLGVAKPVKSSLPNPTKATPKAGTIAADVPSLKAKVNIGAPMKQGPPSAKEEVTRKENASTLPLAKGLPEDRNLAVTGKRTSVAKNLSNSIPPTQPVEEPSHQEKKKGFGLGSVFRSSRTIKS